MIISPLSWKGRTKSLASESGTQIFLSGLAVMQQEKDAVLFVVKLWSFLELNTHVGVAPGSFTGATF